MKKFLLSALLLAMLFAGCKKENTMTADGKPKADEANKTLRIDVNSTDQYTLGVSFQYLQSERTSFIYAHNASPYEFVTSVDLGPTAVIELQSSQGSTLSCIVYYKGVKIPLEKYTTESINHDPSMPSRIYINYPVGR